MSTDSTSRAVPGSGSGSGRRAMGGHFGPPGMGGPVQKAKDFRGTLKRLLGYLKPHTASLITVFFFAVAGAAFTIYAPQETKKAMNHVQDAFVARMMIENVSKAQVQAREAIAGRLEALRNLPAGEGTELQTPGRSGPDPAIIATLLTYMELPTAADEEDPARQAEIVRTVLDLGSKLPEDMVPPRPRSMNITPEQVQDAYRAIAETGGKVSFIYMVRIALVLIVLYLLSSGFSLAMGLVMSGVSQRTVLDLRRAVDVKLAKLPLSYFDLHPHGDILSRVTNDVDTIAHTLQQGLTQIITSLVSIIGYIIMMLVISPLLTLVVLVSLPLYVVSTLAVTKRSQKYFASQQAELGSLSGHVEEMYTGHTIVKAFGREPESIRKFEDVNERLFDSGWKAQFISGIMFPLMNFISNLSYVLICVLGGLWITKGMLRIGDIIAFIQYSRSFTQPIVQTANIANVIQSTVACAERVFEILDEPEEKPDRQDAVRIGSPEGEVAFRNVSFSYRADAPLIGELNLEVGKGHTVAIVGPTGAGKTTLVNLLMRFYELDAGSIAVDGVDITDMKRSDLRRMFGMVLQDAWLFNGTIRDNIAYGRPDASMDDIVRAAQASHADHFIRTLPEGYSTVLNEEATNISQGQKQLLTIARAVLADPAILILDEATSSVDTRTEVLIRKGMSHLMKGRTSFVIAHRLSTIRDAELILVMDQGKIIERGTHAELLSKNGFYAALYNSQFAGRILEPDVSQGEP